MNVEDFAEKLAEAMNPEEFDVIDPGESKAVIGLTLRDNSRFIITIEAVGE